MSRDSTAQQADRKAEDFFEDLWQARDPWSFESSEFETKKYARQLALLEDRRYGRALEIGCGGGYFTQLLAPLAERLVGLDISSSAIQRAAERLAHEPTVELEAANVMRYDLGDEPPWDLIVMSETIYYLGWLYSFFDVGWLAHRIFESISVGGRFLMANTFGVPGDYLLREWIIRTYHDLFRNAGFEVEREEVFTGKKGWARLDVLITLYAKRSGASADSSRPPAQVQE